ADRGDAPNTRLHEGSCRWERRSHSRLHNDWFRGWRGHAHGANGDASKPSILEAPRRRSRPPDDSGRTWSTLFECAAWVRTIGAPKSDSTFSRPEIAAPKLRLEALTSLLRTVWPIRSGIGGLPVILMRAGKRWGSRIQSTVWLTAASKPVEVPVEP